MKGDANNYSGSKVDKLLEQKVGDENWDMGLHQMLRTSQARRSPSENIFGSGNLKEYIKTNIQKLISIIKRIVQVFKIIYTTAEVR